MNRSGLFQYLINATKNGGGEPVSLDDFGDDDEYFPESTVITYYRLSDDEAVTYSVPDSQRDVYVIQESHVVDANGIILY